MKKTTMMHKLIKKEKSILLPIAHDALTAKIIEKTGFRALGIGGFGISASFYGFPDIGLLTQTEMVQATKNINDAVSIPALADADTGYGNPLNVARTIIEYEKIGVAMVFIEDQVSPKRCGHMQGKEVISHLEMVAKIKAAQKAKVDPDFMIMARTDALNTHGLNEAIDRAQLYIKAGAEAIFIEGIKTREQLQLIPQKIKGVPLMVNILEGGLTPIFPQKILEEMGYKFIAYPITSLLITTQTVTHAMEELKNTGTTEHLLPQMASFTDFKKLMGLDKWRKIAL